MADTLKRGINLRTDGKLIQGLQEGFEYISDSDDEMMNKGSSQMINISKLTQETQ